MSKVNVGIYPFDESFVPVSYTHLDVYKRQEDGRNYCYDYGVIVRV